MQYKKWLKFSILAWFFLFSYYSFGLILPEKELAQILATLDSYTASDEQQAIIIAKLKKTSEKKGCYDTPSSKDKKTKAKDSSAPLSTPKKIKLEKNSIGYSGKSFIISPEKQPYDKFDPKLRKFNTIYAHMLTETGEPLIARNDRIDFLSLLKNKKITEANLDRALLRIENKIAKWIKGNEDIFYRTTYVGLAKCFRHRALAHRRDVRPPKDKLSYEGDSSDDSLEDADVEEDTEDDFSSKKVEFTIKAAKSMNCHVRMSPLIYRIPEKWLPLVEVLVGTFLNSTMKAGTLLGNNAARKRFQQYLNSDVRAEGLAYPGLIDDLHNNVRMRILSK